MRQRFIASAHAEDRKMQFGNVRDALTSRKRAREGEGEGTNYKWRKVRIPHAPYYCQPRSRCLGEKLKLASSFLKTVEMDLFIYFA